MTKRLIISSIALILQAMLFLVFFRECSHRVFYEGHEYILSPHSFSVAKIQYDFASRPFLYVNGKNVFSYKGSGFMESIDWNVNWVSKDKIILSENRYGEVYEIYLD